MRGTLAFALVWMAALVALPVLTATSAQAAPGDPYDPNVPIAWQAAGGPTQLYQTQINSDGTVSFVPDGSVAGSTYNSLAFNPLDGYLYATQTRNGANFLIRIGQGGVIVNNTYANLPDAAPSTTGNQSFFSGGIDPATGTMYVLGTNLGATTMTVINLAARTTSTISLSPTLVGSADLTYAQGALWTVNPNGDLIKVDPATGQVTTVKTNVLPDATGGTALYGAGFTLGNGNTVWIDNASGRTYQIDMTSGSYNVFFMGTASPTSNNDGASAPGGPTDLVLSKCATSQSPCRFPAGANTPLTTYPVGQDPATGYIPSQTAAYSITVHNDGPGLSTGSVVQDTLPSGTTFASSDNLTCTAAGSSLECAVGRLAAGASFTFTVTVDIASGTAATLTNTATVLANETDPDLVDNTDTHSLVPPAPAISLAKDVLPGSYTDVTGDDQADAGDTIRYQFVVTNTGNITLTPATVTDPRLSAAGVAISCPSTSLAPGDAMTCTSASYTITQSDVETTSGLITNTATATGTPPGGLPDVTATDSATFQTDVTAGVELVKAADKTALVLGQTINYTFTVTNTGTVTLAPVTISDPMFDLVNAPCTAALAPGASAPCSTTAAHTVTQTDLDRGFVSNTATVLGVPPVSTGLAAVTAQDTVRVPGAQSPALSMLKSAAITTDANDDDLAGVGDEITFTFHVENTGDVTLTGVSVADQLVAPAGPAVTVTCPSTTLAPGAEMDCTSSVYVVTQADVDAGSVDNTATASGMPPTGPPVVTPPSTTTTQTPTAAPGLSLVKSAAITDDANDDDLAGVGDELTFTFRVENTGNVTMTGITVADQLVAPAGPAVTVTCPSTTLAPGAEMDCTSSAYVVTQADVDAGSVDNTATASGTPPTGPAVVTPPSATTTPAPTPAPGLSLVKSAAITDDANNDDLAGVGDELTFTFHVENTGNVTMTGITVADQLVAPAGPAVTVACPATTLAPGAEMDCTSSVYVVTQADVDAGGVGNSATASGVPPTGPAVVTPPSTTVTPGPVGSGLSMVKTAAITDDANDDDLAGVGDELTFTFHVENTGNVTMTGITVADQLVAPAGPAVTVTCPSTTLAPGAEMDCTSSVYVVTQADVDAGGVGNSATASGSAPTGPPVVTPPSSTTTPTPEGAPGLSMVKSAAITDDANGDDLAGVGDEITFTFHVENTGNVTLTDVGVDDETLDDLGLAVSCPTTTLAPRAEMECVSEVYVVTQSDIDAGHVRNVATANGTTPPGTVVTSPPSVVEVPTEPDTGPSGPLAFTGSNVVPSVALGLLLLGLGFLLVLLARRRRDSVQS